MRAIPILLLLPLGAAPGREAPPCDLAGDVVVVETKAHTLSLCSGGRAIATMRVALGSGGVGKQKQGDGKTPLGTYALGAPRPSKEFGTFILIGYPTPGQRKAGFTGSAVGIHGPWRRFDALGEAAVHVDWTAGCVATATQAEVDRVAEFVRRRRPRIVLR